MSQHVAVITGAASGIGLALAKACAQRNMHVVMVDYAAKTLNEAAEKLRLSSHSQVLPVTCDVTQIEEVRRVAEQTYDQFSRVDLLINNAGINGPLVPLWEMPIEQIQNVMDVNLFGVLHGIHVFLPLMFKQENPGHIVNMASVYGLCSGSLVGAYAMSKHAIVALSESLYFDLKRLKKSVDVSVVCPSFVNTPLLVNSNVSSGDILYQKMQNLIERGRSPEDVAEHILREVDHKHFYILPDKEVKDYCEKRVQGIAEQIAPAEHSLEKIMAWIAK